MSGSAADISPRGDGDLDTGPVGRSQQARGFRGTQYSCGGPSLKEAASGSSWLGLSKCRRLCVSLGLGTSGLGGVEVSGTHLHEEMRGGES